MALEPGVPVSSDSRHPALVSVLREEESRNSRGLASPVRMELCEQSVHGLSAGKDAMATSAAKEATCTSGAFPRSGHGDRTLVQHTRQQTPAAQRCGRCRRMTDETERKARRACTGGDPIYERGVSPGRRALRAGRPARSRFDPNKQSNCPRGWRRSGTRRPHRTRTSRRADSTPVSRCPSRQWRDRGASRRRRPLGIEPTGTYPEGAGPSPGDRGLCPNIRRGRPVAGRSPAVRVHSLP